jgi:glycosyltransferase involved in cell wall biosynthesis
MRVSVVVEHRFARSPDGQVWAQTMCDYDFWQRYLEVFESVNVVARANDVPSAPPDWKRADGHGVSFSCVPFYMGPWQYLSQARRVRRAATGSIARGDAVVLRTPGHVSSCIGSFLDRKGHPYAVEVVSDPRYLFARGSVRHPLRPCFCWWFTRRLRQQCARACACSYVTKNALQRGYPPGPDVLSTHYSSVQLAPMSADVPPRSFDRRAGPLKIITVGSLAQPYKAPDVLLGAVAECIRRGLDLRLVFVGDGKLRKELESQAETARLDGRVRFLGQLTSGEAVRAELDRADLFVLPSRAEGLPRALIEAMARALPCIASDVGGVSELLTREDLVPSNDTVALADKIRQVVTNPARMARMSSRNVETAKQYGEEKLRGRRVAFYRHVRDMTQAWLGR